MTVKTKLLTGVYCAACKSPIIQTEPQFDKDYAVYCSFYDCLNHIPVDIDEGLYPLWIKRKPKKV